MWSQNCYLLFSYIKNVKYSFGSTFLKGGRNNYLSIFYIMTDNLQGRNDQIINQIKTLQTTEMKLYDSLESRSLNSDQQKQIIDRINQISQMRINLYASLKDMYSYYQQDVSDSRNTMNQQMVSVDVIENELNDSKRRLNLLEAQKNNKIRLVEINTFYGKQYDAHKQIMQIVVIICIPVLILSVLANKGILPPKLNTLLIGIIIIIGLFIIGAKIIDLSNRDNMNFDEYNWYFNKDEAPTTSTEEDTNTSGSDPWETPTYTCSGAECCYENSTYDEEQNKCIPNAQYNANQATSSSTTTSSETEAFTVLSKYASSANYPEARLQRNVQSYNF
jgi:hypothetical protein